MKMGVVIPYEVFFNKLVAREREKRFAAAEQLYNQWAEEFEFDYIQRARDRASLEQWAAYNELSDQFDKKYMREQISYGDYFHDASSPDESA